MARYEGTRLGRQELNAEMLDDVEGALWTRAMIDAARKPVKLVDMARVVVSVDPSGTKGDEDSGDWIGIVVVGKGVDGRAYVLADRTCKLSPDGWGEDLLKPTTNSAQTGLSLNETSAGPWSSTSYVPWTGL